MIPVTYPNVEFKLKEEGTKKFIFDELRKVWLVITPEEWVRQHFIFYLLHVKKYPAALIAVEKRLKLGELTKRFDILIYNANHQPWMMVECKASSVALKPAVLEQVLRYNISIPVPYLVITNGYYCKAFQKIDGRLHELEDLPNFC